MSNVNILKFLDLICDERNFFLDKHGPGERERYYVLSQMFILLMKLSDNGDVTTDDILYTLSQLLLEDNQLLKDKFWYLSFPEEGDLIFDVPSLPVYMSEDVDEPDLIIQIAELLMSMKTQWIHELNHHEINNQTFYQEWLTALQKKGNKNPALTINNIVANTDSQKSMLISDFLRESTLSDEQKIAAMQFLNKASNHKMGRLVELYLKYNFKLEDLPVEQHVSSNWQMDPSSNVACKIAGVVLFKKEDGNAKAKHDAILVNDTISDREPDLEAHCKVILNYEDGIAQPQVDSLIISGKTAKIKPLFSLTKSG